MLAQAMSSTSATAPCSTQIDRRTRPRTWSASGVICSMWASSVPGLKDVAGVAASWCDAGPRAPRHRQGVQLCLRRGGSRGLFETADEKEVMVVARVALVVCEPERQPDFGVIVHEVDGARHHTDDLEPAPVDFDTLADDRPPAECGLPEVV